MVFTYLRVCVFVEVPTYGWRAVARLVYPCSFDYCRRLRLPIMLFVYVCVLFVVYMASTVARPLFAQLNMRDATRKVVCSAGRCLHQGKCPHPGAAAMLSHFARGFISSAAAAGQLTVSALVVCGWWCSIRSSATLDHWYLKQGT